ncbi:hypothetical protein AAGF08_20505, partial [Algoriphagus sp. SE2]|uniref:hypothetical protein n=1 Tax=Algoriphagus sp. SE2 TaxID=3141536 RepID=UPI0031CD027C
IKILCQIFNDLKESLEKRVLSARHLGSKAQSELRLADKSILPIFTFKCLLLCPFVLIQKDQKIKTQQCFHRT